MSSKEFVGLPEYGFSLLFILFPLLVFISPSTKKTQRLSVGELTDMMENLSCNPLASKTYRSDQSLHGRDTSGMERNNRNMEADTYIVSKKDADSIALELQVSFQILVWKLNSFHEIR